MDEGYEKERFEKLGIKTSVAERFRVFSKKMNKSQSMTLLLMIDFFEENGISPHESIGPNMQTLEHKISLLIKKRINGVIAIMKDIEKTQTKPTAAMIQSLFVEAEPPKRKRMVEKNDPYKKNKMSLREKLEPDNEL
ncbi:BfmA/BtgA family mobilization protein [uncultured Aquimarina sp.]|uniref:BfmA/BtgA family mobilization protein n=1 Tax=uncultured Aquimarina sp. TaxID=575652 RepID=UPI0026230B83|nr:BfmA/BtgA family mobilization protein [uncultured Aquimarina sp.]